MKTMFGPCGRLARKYVSINLHEYKLLKVTPENRQDQESTYVHDQLVEAYRKR
jgi:hypothetical protein